MSRTRKRTLSHSGRKKLSLEDTFLGRNCPEVLALADLFAKGGTISALPSDQLQKVFEAVVVATEDHKVDEAMELALAERPALKVLFVGLLSFFSAAVAVEATKERFEAVFARLEPPAALGKLAVQAFTARRQFLLAKALTRRVELPTVDGVKWRVDVVISTTAMSRVFQPAILVQLTLSDGRVRSFECSVAKFHEMRYNTAKVLKSMADYEQHPIIARKIED